MVKRHLIVSLTLTVISKLIQAADPPSRAYFNPVAQNNSVFILGGSSDSLDVYTLDYSTGISASSPVWNYSPTGLTTLLQPYERGVAFGTTKNVIYAQGGLSTTDTVRKMVTYTPTSPSSGSWAAPPTFSSSGSITPSSRAFMTANINPLNNIAFYYGGIPLSTDGKTPVYPAIENFTVFDTNSNTWTDLNPDYPPKRRPGRMHHKSVLVNQQLFIFGGLAVPFVDGFTNNTQGGTFEAGFESVLVYDIDSNTAVTMATTGDIPPARLGVSATIGRDGQSIVTYGGYNTSVSYEFQSTTDIYVLDTCTLTWSKPSVKGTGPGALAGHGAVTIGDYMVTMLGLYNYTIEGGSTAYSTKVNILDMKEWKWVDSISQEAVSSATEGTASCNFTMPNVNGDLTYEPFNYDESVIVNPNQSLSQDDSTKKKEGFGIGFGLLVLILIVGGVWFYIRRLRKKNRPAANPRWARNNSGHHQRQSDYPLYVYNKELEEGGNVQASSRAFAPNDIKTYTASDHDQWEQQVGTNHTDNNDIWKRMHGLNDAPILNDEQIYQNRHHRDTAKEEGYSKLVDTE